MPAIYTSFEIEPDDSAEVCRSKIYLGIISIGESSYTLAAAIAEVRKQADMLQKRVNELTATADTLETRARALHKEYDLHKAQFWPARPTTEGPDSK